MRNYIINTIYPFTIHPQKPRPFRSSTACEKRFFLCFQQLKLFFSYPKQYAAIKRHLSAVTALFLIHKLLVVKASGRHFWIPMKITAEKEHHLIIFLSTYNNTGKKGYDYEEIYRNCFCHQPLR